MSKVKQEKIIFDGSNYHEWEDELQIKFMKNNVSKVLKDKRPKDPKLINITKKVLRKKTNDI